MPGALVGGPIIGLAEAYTKTYQAELFPWAGDNVDQVVPYVVMRRAAGSPTGCSAPGMERV